MSFNKMYHIQRENNKNKIKADLSYWDAVWENKVKIPEPINTSDKSLSNYVNCLIHDNFKKIFSTIKTNGLKLLEVGSANSQWLPYFAREYDFKVTGLDYSTTGCKRAEIILKNAGVQGVIINIDFFNPSPALLDEFDVVFSFGVVEHFSNTTECIKALKSFLKKDGILITIIPNMVGLIGFIQKMINRPVYNIHVPIRPVDLLEAHEKTGMKVIECKYFLSTNFGINNLIGIDKRSVSYKIKKILLGVLSSISRIVWFWEMRFGELRTSSTFSPYINCIAKRS